MRKQSRTLLRDSPISGPCRLTSEFTISSPLAPEPIKPDARAAPILLSLPELTLIEPATFLP